VCTTLLPKTHGIYVAGSNEVDTSILAGPGFVLDWWRRKARVESILESAMKVKYFAIIFHDVGGWRVQDDRNSCGSLQFRFCPCSSKFDGFFHRFFYTDAHIFFANFESGAAAGGNAAGAMTDKLTNQSAAIQFRECILLETSLSWKSLLLADVNQA